MVRSDGRAMYNFASAVDDAEMKVSHVIRADEHLSNTPKQLILCEALEVKPPEFAHVPMVLAPGGGKKMSKREGAASLGWYRERGYLASALRNYLARLGWSLDDRTELLSDEEIIRGFSLERVSVSAAALDPDKLLWMNAEHIRKMSIRERSEAVIPVLQKEGLLGKEITVETRLWLEQVVEAIGDRLKVLSDVVEYGKFLFVEELEYEPRAVRKRLLKEGAAEILLGARDALSKAEPFNEEHVEDAVRRIAEKKGLSGAAVIHPIRVAVTGKAVGPGIFEALVLLGKEKTLARLDKAVRFLEKGEFPGTDT
jgi:glutamyl-tRNA synthetase